MDLYESSFAKILIFRDDIAEVMINDGVEMDAKMIEQCHDFLLSHLPTPCSLLINKVNSYAYNFDAQVSIARLKQINAMAMVAYNRMTMATTEILVSTTLRDVGWNMKVFPNRSEALTWLMSEQEKSRYRQLKRIDNN